MNLCLIAGFHTTTSLYSGLPFLGLDLLVKDSGSDSLRKSFASIQSSEQYPRMMHR